MAALVQTFPQQTTTVTMLQTRPSSSSGTFSTPPQLQQHQGSRSPQLGRNIYPAPTSSGSYRGHTSLAPVAPYAFATTPTLASSGATQRQIQNPRLRTDNRTSSAPVIPVLPLGPQSVNSGPSISSRQRYSAAPTTNTPGSSGSSSRGTKDDTAITTRQASNDLPGRPLSTCDMSNSPSKPFNPQLSTAARPSPDRYRRSHRSNQGNGSPAGSAIPSGSGMATVGHLYNHPGQSNSSPSLASFQSFRGPVLTPTPGNQTRKASVDDMQLSRQLASEQQAKRYRRRSMGSLETAGLSHSNDTTQTASPHPTSFINTPTSKGESRPASSHTHNGSTESVSSSRSNPSSKPPSSTRESINPAPNQTSLQVTPVSKQEIKTINVPARTSDANKRMNTPSPLSKPVNMSPISPPVQSPKSPQKVMQPTAKPESLPPAQQPVIAESPAAQQLAALGKKDEKKNKSSRLRRAFSFGSASELRRASAQNNLDKNMAAQQRKQKHEEEMEAEQAAIAQKQEASGLGESIYSGQGQFFTGSTDNLSISSTASSASVMLRKMGKGMKKSTRSLVGLFRPKSVVGVPAADSSVVEASVAQVSMVTVEAEREKVNVNPDPHEQAGGGTGFPHLERNSMDAAQAASESSRGSHDTSSRGRRSIVGGERERAEVLAAVKKGILKRSGTDSGNSSPIRRPLDSKTPDFNLPQIPHVNDSPHSSAPSTPGDDQPPRSGHRRTDSIAIEGEDYFAGLTGFASFDTKSAPVTPTVPRNISFSPRIQFHDTWPGTEYDRRGEIATCNRLTPMLAQQIKEELNTFKMEMEVHESSKVYTHFF